MLCMVGENSVVNKGMVAFGLSSKLKKFCYLIILKAIGSNKFNKSVEIKLLVCVIVACVMIMCE
jgi:hypothetical protein